jgi:ATPase subunit of ABC transporter with duplicated ATPase domains
MTHHPISICKLGLSFPQKTCFSGFSTQIHSGMHIALIGRNGSGKSTLLQILQGQREPSEGKVTSPEGITFGCVPQVIEDFEKVSGGQRLNEALTLALSLNPNVLLLDEPTNHLDLANRRSLMRLLRKFPGTLILVSHDVELLRDCIDTLWHIQDGKVTIFSGNYDDYIQDIHTKRVSLEHDLKVLDREKKQTHLSLMKEQLRAKKSKIRGEKKREQGYWPTLVAGGKKRQAQESTGHNRKLIFAKKEVLMEKLEELRLPEVIDPKFSLACTEVRPAKTLVSISNGSCGYGIPLLKDIFFSLQAGGRVAITGENGAGKSTLVRGILNDSSVIKSGEWVVPKQEDIGYLDQHYSTLKGHDNVFETIRTLKPSWSHGEIRCHLNDFLFRKNEEILASIETLSGGEKARLSLAQIAAKSPKLLILDEITNNLDLETRNHVIQILRHFPGALIVISHDQDFLKEIGIENFCEVKNGGTKK